MSRRRRWVRAASVLAVALTVAAACVVRPSVFRAESNSMAPAIGVGDLVFATGAGGGMPQRGDVVVFSDPGAWAETVARLTSSDASVAGTFVKRVVGLPGERVACCDADGRLTVDGVSLAEPYRDTHGLASVLAFDVAVPAGSVFVLGDNRGASIDSRYLGAVPLTSIVAVERVVLPAP